MIRNLTCTAAAAAVVAAPTAALADVMTYRIELSVAMHCTVEHQASGSAVAEGAVPLGQIREFCNAPAGYDVVVSYAPGTLQGATLAAGEDRVILNGSGEAVLSRVPGPRIRERMISAIPGNAGFDTDHLSFTLRPNQI